MRKKIIRDAIGFLLAGSWWISNGFAEQESDHDKESQVFLGDVLVTPRRIPGVEVREGRFPGNVTVISESEIAQRTTAAGQGVVGLLAQQEGVSLIDSHGFGTGADTGLNLRGFVNSSRTDALVLVNGVRQNRITGDEVHWLAIPPEHIERIEIIRGAGGTIYGEGALSGVINIITKQGTPQPIQFEGSTEVGSYNHLRSTSMARGSKGTFSYSLGSTREVEGGYRDRTSSRGTTVNFFSGWKPTPTTDLKLHVTQHGDTTGFAGGLTKPQVEQDRRNPGSFFGFNEDHLDSESLQLTQQSGQAWNLVGNIYRSTRNGDSVTSSRFGTRTLTTAGGLRASHEASGTLWKTTTIFGVDLAKDKASTGNRGADKSESNRRGYGLFFEEALELFKKLTLTVGIRYDRSHYDEALTFPTFNGLLRFQGASPKVGVTYSVNEAFNLYASAARAFKAPNIDDLDAVLPPFNDAVDLKPQRADHYEIGARWQAAPWAQVKWDGFIVQTKDEILFNPFTFANANFTTRRAGMELNVSGELPKSPLSYYATYTLMRGRFHKGAFTGYELPATPHHRATAGVRCPITRRFSTDLDVLWVGQQWRINDFNNRFPADIYGVVNWGLEYKFQKMKAHFRILNLLGEEYESFPSSGGTSISTGENPSPPRTFVTGVSWEF